MAQVGPLREWHLLVWSSSGLPSGGSSRLPVFLAPYALRNAFAVVACFNAGGAGVLPDSMEGTFPYPYW
jgi:hypothetical protein